MFGCYRTGDANDAETYVAAITAVLSRFEKDVITAVTHPVSGLPGQIDWLPKVTEVKKACELAELPMRNQREREKRIAEQLEARRLEEEAKAKKPTYEEMKAKYGEDFGIKNPDRKRRAPVPAPTIDQLRHHYQHYGLQFKPKNHQELEDHIERGFSPGSI